MLMGVGVGLVGVVTATFASWVLERAAARNSDADEPATRGQVRDLSQRLAELTARLGDPPVVADRRREINSACQPSDRPAGSADDR